MHHPLSNIHPEAKIGDNVTIEAFVTVEKDVEIGDGTWVGPNACILAGSRIGENCEIHSGAVISGKPQDLKYQGEETLTRIGDNTVIREFVTINKGTSDRLETVVGSNCLLMAYVHIAHDCLLGNHCIIANSVQIAGHVELHDHARIGGTTAVHQFVKIGAHTMVGGGSLVRKDVPPYIIAAREPLIYSGVNSVGLSRHGFAPERINLIQEAYRLYFLKGNNKTAALQMIEELDDCEEKKNILDFIRSSERGIIKGYH